MRVSISLLSYDHGFIQQIIDILKIIAEKEPEKMDENGLLEIQQFLNQFMDEFHHVKEEKIAFPMASETLREEIQILVKEHKHARDLLHNMSLAIKSKGFKNYAVSARELVEHMTLHIKKEESEIFPKIEAHLSQEQDREIYKEFEAFSKQFENNYYRSVTELTKRIQDHFLGSEYYKTFFT